MNADVPTPRCYLYHLDTSLYSELAVSVSLKGLSKIVRRALVGSGKFRTDRTTNVVAGKRGTLEECFQRAMQKAQRTDFGARGLFHLLRVRDAVLTFTDGPTIAALDVAVANYAHVQLLAPAAQLAEPWPGAEWFLTPDRELEGLLPQTRGPVEAAIAGVMARHLGVDAATLQVTTFDAHGGPNWTRSLEGTFIVRPGAGDSQPI